ncbi:MAG TPA: thioredoxin family protein [Gemmataceae bacterium]|nr:thioredoxin family protein [Gemmataceae bacterium]
MDRSFLFQPQVIAASRSFVCVRLATYEDETEADFLKAFTPTKSGELENSVFGILAPDGQQKLIRPGRGPKQAFAGPAEMAEAMKKIAAKYPGKTTEGPMALPLVATIKLGVNVAAADNQLLVIVVGKDAVARKPLEEKLAALIWNDEFVGRFVFASGTAADLATVEVKKQEAGLLIVAPEQFGRTANVVSSLSVDASTVRIATVLRNAVAHFKPTEKTFMNHVRFGQSQGVFWEPRIPVTDPMEINARERGKKNKN